MRNDFKSPIDIARHLDWEKAPRNPLVVVPWIASALGVSTAVAAVIYIVATVVVAGAITRALTPKLPKMKEGLLANQRQAASDAEIVYGKIRKGGVINYMEATGDENKFLHMFITMAYHEVEAIDDIYINDKIATISSDYVTLAHAPVYGQPLNTSGTASSADTDDWQSKIYIRKFLGAETQNIYSVLSGITNPPPIPSGFRGQNVACLYVRLEWDREVFASGIPLITAVIRGKKVQNLAGAAQTYPNSANAALCIRDYLTSYYGLNTPSDTIDTVSFTTAYNDSANAVATAGGGTQPAFTVDGVLSTGQPLRENLQDLVLCTGGSLFYSEGQFQMKAGVYDSPTVTFTLDDLRGPIELSTAQARRDNFNSVYGTFIDADQDWIEVDYPSQPLGTNDFLAEDNYLENPLNLDFPLVTNSARAQRLAKLTLFRSREQMTFKARFSMKAFNVKLGETVILDLERYGWSVAQGFSKVFEVAGWDLQTDGEGGELVVELILRETSADAYDWNASESALQANNTNLPKWNYVPAPTALVLSNSGYLNTKTYVPGIGMSWTASSNGFVSGYRVEWKQSTDTVYNYAETAATSYTVSPVEAGKTYNVRISAFNSVGVSSSYLNGSIAISGDATVPSAPGQPTVTGGYGAATVTWAAPTTNTDSSTLTDLFQYLVYRGTTANPTTLIGRVSGEVFTDTGLSASTTYYYRVRAQDFSGNLSGYSLNGLGTTNALLVGIESVSKSGDTVTVTYTDASTDTFTVNGVASASKSGDTLTITYDDGTTSTLTDGNGISSVTRSGETVTVTYDDGTTSQFTVANGKDAIVGDAKYVTVSNITKDSSGTYSDSTLDVDIVFLQGTTVKAKRRYRVTRSGSTWSTTLGTRDGDITDETNTSYLSPTLTVSGSNALLRVVYNDTTVISTVSAQFAIAEDGLGIASVEKSGSTVTVTYDNNTTDTFTVNGVASVSKTGSQLTITYDNGTTSTIDDGEPGNGIATITKTGTTVTVEYDDGTTSTFTVDNGIDAIYGDPDPVTATAITKNASGVYSATYLDYDVTFRQGGSIVAKRRYRLTRSTDTWNATVSTRDADTTDELNVSRLTATATVSGRFASLTVTYSFGGLTAVVTAPAFIIHDGSTGSQGPRGAGRWYISVTAFPTNNSAVTTAFTNAVGYAPINRDQAWFQLADGTQQVYIYNGTSWDEQLEAVDGNLVVAGTLTSDKLAAEDLSAIRADLGEVNINKLLRIEDVGASLIAGRTSAGAYNQNGFYIGREDRGGGVKGFEVSHTSTGNGVIEGIIHSDDAGFNIYNPTILSGGSLSGATTIVASTGFYNLGQNSSVTISAIGGGGAGGYGLEDGSASTYNPSGGSTSYRLRVGSTTGTIITGSSVTVLGGAGGKNASYTTGSGENGQSSAYGTGGLGGARNNAGGAASGYGAGGGGGGGDAHSTFDSSGWSGFGGQAGQKVTTTYDLSAYSGSDIYLEVTAIGAGGSSTAGDYDGGAGSPGAVEYTSILGGTTSVRGKQIGNVVTSKTAYSASLTLAGTNTVLNQNFDVEPDMYRIKYRVQFTWGASPVEGATAGVFVRCYFDGSIVSSAFYGGQDQTGGFVNHIEEADVFVTASASKNVTVTLQEYSQVTLSNLFVFAFVDGPYKSVSL